MKLSFIIPAHNEQAVIGQTLAALRDAVRDRPGPFEVIVVNDDSSDDTAGLARDAGARVIDVAHRNIAAVRNAGARAANGDALVFIDADTRINGPLLLAACAALAGGAVGGGATVRYDGELPLYVRLLLPWVERRFRRKKVLQGCFLFCRRDAFMAVGGFDEKYFVAEEVHLGVALRKRGRMVRLEESVLTSGRKYREHPWWKVIWLMLNIRQSTARGRAWVQDRRNLGFWYGSRRDSAKAAAPAREERPPT